MIYYIRKITRSKWPEHSLSPDAAQALREVYEIKADTITSELRTTDNKLSLWRIEEKHDTIEDIVPLISGFDRPGVCDIVYIPEEYFAEAGIELEHSPQDARVGDETMCQFHYNALIRDYYGLGQFSRVILRSSTFRRRFTLGQVKRKMVEMGLY